MFWMPLLSFVFMIYLPTMVLVASWVAILLINHRLVGFYCCYYYCGCKTFRYNTGKTNELLWIRYEGYLVLIIFGRVSLAHELLWPGFSLDRVHFKVAWELNVFFNAGKIFVLICKNHLIALWEKTFFIMIKFFFYLKNLYIWNNHACLCAFRS